MSKDSKTQWLGKLDQDISGKWIGKCHNHCVSFRGYIMFYLDENKNLTLERIALRGKLDDECETQQIGIISILGGPSPIIIPDGGNLPLTAISIDHQRRLRDMMCCQNDDDDNEQNFSAEFVFFWSPEGTDHIRLTFERVTLTAENNPPRGYPTEIKIEEATFLCEKINQDDNMGPQYEMPIKFINWSKYESEELERICQDQIDKVNEVWNLKNDQSPLKLNYVSLLPTKETPTEDQNITLKTLRKYDNKSTGRDYIGIHFFELRQLRLPGFAEAPFKPGSANGFTYLTVEQAKARQYLLAHEIGHILGLGDCDTPNCIMYNTATFHGVVPKICNKHRLETIFAKNRKPKSILTVVEPTNRVVPLFSG